MALVSCSTQRNTALTRRYHSMKVRYNIYFNGKTQFDEGLKAIQDANQDDYTHVLPLYPVSNHEAAKAATSQMETTIEKCRKCIKLHSIKKKPEKLNEHKRNDPAYKAWLRQEEFNPSMPAAWLLLGKAEFHKGDFLESVGTFNYISQHFDYDRDATTQCKLWTVRAYAEEGWLYEADDLLRQVPMDGLRRKNESLYAAVAADLRLRQEQYKEAIPYLKLRMDDEARKGNRPRFAFVLGQIYEQQGQIDLARAYYKKVIRLYPAWEMDFQARMRLHTLNPNKQRAIRDLGKMARQDKYKDRLDRIYGGMADIELQRRDTVKALEYLDEAIEKSTSAGSEKARVLVLAGDLYFDRKDYAKAQPCYTEAATILDSHLPEYKRIKRRAEVLDELVAEQTTIALQDSLLRLSYLSPEEQMRVAEKLVADLREQEKQDSIEAAQLARAEQNGLNDGPRSVNTSNMLGGGGASGEWYFYNPNLIRQGKQQFAQKWGKRQLEDNWRRRNKTATASFDAAPQEDAADELLPDSLASDSLAALPAMSDDPHDPNYYIQQIPATDEDRELAEQQIATAMYNLVGIYRDQLEQPADAEAALEAFRQRFPADPRLSELDALHERLRLLRENPEYGDSLRRAAHYADSLYAVTYEAYRQSRFAEVKARVQQADTTCAESPVMPHFLFLGAVAVAKTEGQDAFIAALRDMVARAGDSSLGAKAKDMLGLLNQGMEAQQGGELTSLADQRTEQLEEQKQEMDTLPAPPAKPHLLLVLPKAPDHLNELLYEVALYNFTQFLIKDFDLALRPAYSDTEAALEVTGFDKADEVAWYQGMLEKSEHLTSLFGEWNVRIEY